MILYNRLIQKDIENNLFDGKIILIYWARQVWKTTIVKNIMQEYPEDSKYINCELINNRNFLETQDPELIRKSIWDYKLWIFDETQNVKNIWLILKIIHDTYSDIQIVATWSSSFELANKVSEPLTWRCIRYKLFPLSFHEIKPTKEYILSKTKLENILIYGLYPDVYNSDSDQKSKERLEEIASNYLYKDILEFEWIKKSEQLENILRLLAFQIGNEVSYQEMANNLWIHATTIEKYISLLEQCFVIFRLHSFSRNQRNELKKWVKIYFYDLWIRNFIINNLNQIKFRNDVWALWENFCILEKIKFNNYWKLLNKSYFWRNYQQKEIDYIEENNWILDTFEFKWNENKKTKQPKDFLEGYGKLYEKINYTIINRQNYYKLFEI